MPDDSVTYHRGQYGSTGSRAGIGAGAGGGSVFSNAPPAKASPASRARGSNFTSPQLKQLGARFRSEMKNPSSVYGNPPPRGTGMHADFSTGTPNGRAPTGPRLPGPRDARGSLGASLFPGQSGVDKNVDRLRSSLFPDRDARGSLGASLFPGQSGVDKNVDRLRSSLFPDRESLVKGFFS